MPGANGLEIHERLPGGTGWAKTAILPVAAREAGNAVSLALAGDWLAAGRGELYNDHPEIPGTVQLFRRDAVDRNVWHAAGTLQGPGPNYGRKVLWNRGELISTIYNGSAAYPVVIRRFQGGSATIRDDDRGKLAILVAAQPEPAAGSVAGECYAELPLPAEADVPVSYNFLNGTALEGLDFTGAAGNTVIPAGSSRTEVPFAFLADNLVEGGESLTLRMTTAGQSALEVSARIRDSNPAPVVMGTATPLLEGLGESTVTVRQLPVTEGATLPVVPVPMGVRIQGIDSPPAALPLATLGTDLPGLVESISLSQATTAISLQVTASQDEQVEPAEEAVSAVFDLPAGKLSPGTLGLVHEGALPPLPATVSGPAGVSSIVSGGGWVFAQKRQTSLNGAPAAGVVICYWVADAGRPKVAVSQVIPLNVHPIAYSQLDTDGKTLAVSGMRVINGVNRGVLMLYNATGPADAPWELSMEFIGHYTGESGQGIQRVKLIDGDQLWWGEFLYERTTGHSPWRLINQSRLQKLEATVVEAGTDWLIYQNFDSKQIRCYRRVRGPQSGWILANTFTNPDPGFTVDVRLRNRTLYIFQYPGQLNIYRESPQSAWALEQSLTLPVISTPFQFTTESSFGSEGKIYTRTGPATAPWTLSGQVPVDVPVLASSDSSSQLIQLLESNTDTARFRLYQAGLPLAIVDDDSLIYSFVEGSGFGFAANESYSGENVGKMVLSASRNPPFQEQIRVRSRDTGSAVAGKDYAPVDFRVVCGPRASVPFVGAEIPVRVFSDRLVEGPETFDLIIDPPVFGKVISPGTFTIHEPQITGRQVPAGAATLYEPPSGSMMQSVEYILQVAPDRDVTLTPSLVTGGTAATGTDFTLPVSPLILKAETNRVRVPILIHADSLDESNETVFLKMTGAEIPQSNANVVLTIVDANVPGLGFDEGYTTPQGTPLTADGVGGAPPGVQSNDSGVSGGVYQIPAQPAWGTVTMQPNGDFTAAPGPNAIGELLFSYQVEMIPYRRYLDPLAAWKYLHPVNGVNPAVVNPAFPSTWATPGFDDSAWSSGVGTLSYGGLATPALPNAVNLAVPPSGSRYTSYFRTTFSSATAATLPLRLRLYCDDAAIVYINGIERGRLLVNTATAFATAPDTFTLLSGSPGQTDAEEGIVRTVDLPAVPLLAGSNVLAISLHNASATSSDLGLRLESLEAGIITGPLPVRLTITEVAQPPTGTADSFICPQNSTFMSSDNYGPGVLDNDGLYSPSGSPYDPITEVVFADVSTGTLIKIGTDGHFKYTPPPDFTGSAGFTYQIRDKDGLSPPIMVTLNVQPSLPYDLWRQQLVPGGGPSAGDTDGDGWNDFLEYALGSFPTQPALPAGPGPGILPASVSGVPRFSVQLRKASDLAWWIECTSSPGEAAWITLVESRGLNYRYTHSNAISGIRNDTAESFAIDVSPNTTLQLAPRLFYRLRTERIAPQ